MLSPLSQSHRHPCEKRSLRDCWTSSIRRFVRSAVIRGLRAKTFVAAVTPIYLGLVLPALVVRYRSPRVSRGVGTVCASLRRSCARSPCLRIARQ